MINGHLNEFMSILKKTLTYFFIPIMLLVTHCRQEENSYEESTAKPKAEYLLFQDPVQEIEYETNENKYQMQQLLNNSMNSYNWYSIQLSFVGSSIVKKIATPDTFTFGKESYTAKGRGIEFKIPSNDTFDSDFRIFLGMRNETIRQGKYKFISAKLDSFTINTPFSFYWNNQKYELILKGDRDTIYENRINVLATNYVYRRFSITIRNKECSQILQKDTLYIIREANFHDRIWIGDLDNDGIPDVINPLANGPYNPLTVLLLSSKAGKNEIVKQVTHIN